MSKRIIVLSHSLEIGGAERSLIGYLGALAADGGPETELFLYRHAGELMDTIPEGIKLLPQDARYASLAAPVKGVLRRGHGLIAAGRLFGKLAAKRYVKRHGLPQENSVALEYSHKYTKAFMPRIAPDTVYDLAVSFLTPHYFAAEKINAKKRVAFIHTDYSAVAVNRRSELKMWAAYDLIAACSDAARSSFISVFPELSDRVAATENINDADMIKRMADKSEGLEEMPDDGCVKLLSVGRFVPEKNFTAIPEVTRRLLEQGDKVKWYIIGYGDDAPLRRAIEEQRVSESVIILGKKSNPYPYMRRCDIYVQPSLFEGKAVTVLEAQILQKPVVISAYPTAASQLEDGADGVIAPQSREGLAETLHRLLNDRERMLALSHGCASRNYENKEKIKLLLELL